VVSPASVNVQAFCSLEQLAGELKPSVPGKPLTLTVTLTSLGIEKAQVSGPPQ
jgi:hypothetical protein